MRGVGGDCHKAVIKSLAEETLHRRRYSELPRGKILNCWVIINKQMQKMTSVFKKKKKKRNNQWILLYYKITSLFCCQGSMVLKVVCMQGTSLVLWLLGWYKWTRNESPILCLIMELTSAASSFFPFLPLYVHDHMLSYIRKNYQAKKNLI